MADPASSMVPRSEAGTADRTRSGTGSSFRPDLEGLRGVAILLVLVFHAGLPGTGGGFVGVDVFFVLSGFLITGLLIRERETTGRVDLPAFYARRARRILPAALVVLVGILAASWAMLPPLDLGQTAGDVVAAALSVGNIRFAAQATDYFASGVAPSPVLHYWSLGVEEQFYLLWPALLILATRAGRVRAGALAMLVAVGIVSLAASLYLTDAQPAWAFYSLPTRAWELALGGALAVVMPRLEGLPDRLVSPIGWIGLAAIVVALVAIDPATPYPGLAALLPTIGAAAIVVAGARRGSVGLILERSPMRWLGRISYSLYLVHWPILVLPAASLAVDQELPIQERIGLALVAVVVAAACQRFVEAPFHRGRRARLPSGRTLAFAGSAVVLTISLAAGVAVASAGRLIPGGVASAVEPSSSSAPLLLDGTPGPSDVDPFASTAPSIDASGPPTLSSPSPDASPSPTGGASASPASTPPPPPTGPQPLPRDVRPALADARNDFAPLERDHCMLGALDTTLRPCVYGDRSSSTTVALVGDSHAAEWFPAVEAIAKQRDWRLVVMTKVSCRFVDLPMISRELKRPYTECYTWRDEVVARLKALRPALTIVSVARSMQATTAANDDPTRQGRAIGPLLAGVPGKIAIIVDTPQSLYDVPACISAHINDVRPCQTPRATAFSWRYLKLERAAVAATGATLVNMSDQICAWKSCPVILHDMIIYKDSHHLTATFARSLAGVLESRLPAF